MGKYMLTNWQTAPFRKKTFEGQLERYAKACVVSLDNPQQVLAVIPIFGNAEIIDIVHGFELGKNELPSSMRKSFDGEFVEIPSLHGKLYRRFSLDEARYGICKPDMAWKAERDSNGKVRIYNTIKVFCLYKLVPILGKQYLNGWFPNQLYYHYYGYNYHPLSNLSEPLQM